MPRIQTVLVRLNDSCPSKYDMLFSDSNSGLLTLRYSADDTRYINRRRKISGTNF